MIDWNSSLTNLYKNRPPKSVFLLKENGINHIFDLLWILPLRINNFPKIMPFSEAKIGQGFSGKGSIIKVSKRPIFSKRGRVYNLSAIVADAFSDEKLNLTWFNAYPNLIKKLEEIKEIEFFGNVSEWKGQKQIITPQMGSGTDSNQLIEYPTINSVSGKNIKKIIEKIPDFLWDKIEESLPEKILKKRQLLEISESLRIAHGKKIKGDFESAKKRLIYEEFFQEQLKIFARKINLQKRKSVQIEITEKVQKLTQSFPYELTNCQKKSLDEIFSDLAGQPPMMRFLQGDVGSGKTTLAFLAILASFESGLQSVIMCPTESLAEQHFSNFSKLFKNHPCKLLIGSMKESEKKELRENLSNGKISIVFGTHSLISESVKFLNLGLIVIDEQHKFGVEQRGELFKKYPNANVLLMSATPIPRSLNLTKYGDLSLSRILEFPHGKKNIKTKIITKSTFGQFLNFLNTRISMGEQAFLVVPAIHESERSIFLENLYLKFKKWFPKIPIATVHGQMHGEERRKIMQDFKDKKISILIATSVIEVGIDIENATIMSIFSPELFGLSSLHQLRGRVGRGKKPSFCFLMALKEISDEAQQRLKIIESTLDGFEISEKDLQMRGEGEQFGTNQSGIGNHRKIANLMEHEKILLEAREDLEELIQNQNQKILGEIEQLGKKLDLLSII